MVFSTWFHFPFWTGIFGAFYTLLLILMFSKHFWAWRFQFKKHLSVFQRLSECKYKSFSCRLCPIPLAVFRFLLHKIDVPKLSPGDPIDLFNFYLGPQASAYEKQGHSRIACLITKFRGYRCVKSHSPPTK